jgi:hypothetical protein
MTPLPSSGTLKFSDINVELARSSTATIALDQAENGTYATINLCSAQRPSSANPALVSEWYSYNHTVTASTFLTGTEGPESTSTAACDLLAINSATIYTANSLYYTNTNCSTLVANGFHRNSSATTWYQFSAGALVATGACAGTTTTTTTTAACVCNRAGECGAGCACAHPLNFPCTTAADCNAPCF